MDSKRVTMSASYAGSYTDARGTTPIVFTDDGETIRTEIRGVSFEGQDFDLLSPTTGARARQDLSLSGEELTNCTLSAVIPIVLLVGDTARDGAIEMTLTLEPPTATERWGLEHVRLTLTGPGSRIESGGTSGWFEDELLDLARKLPQDTFVKSCFFCQYSDYSPYGHGLFGSMMCFRNLKTEYLKVTTKQEFWPVHNRCDRVVRETYLCEEFVARTPGTGYRG